MSDSVPTRLIIVRHGETEWNAQQRVQGHLDSPLTERGIKQAQGAAEVLRGFAPFDFLYSSDLGRAMQTAEIINRDLGLEILPESGLRERLLGIFQGHTWDEAREKFPEAYGAFLQKDPDYIIPEGESSRQRQGRHIECLSGLVDRHPGKSLLIIAHGGVLNSVFRHSQNLPCESARTFSLLNGAVHVITVNDGLWRVDVWGSTGHLESSDLTDDY